MTMLINKTFDDISAPSIFTPDEYVESMKSINEQFSGSPFVNEQFWGDMRKEQRYDVKIQFTLSSGSDEVFVDIDLSLLGSEPSEGYDSAIGVHNNDWAGLRDQQQAISQALDKFYELGLNVTYPLVGE
jgi:hypothetical protein